MDEFVDYEEYYGEDGDDGDQDDQEPGEDVSLIYVGEVQESKAVNCPLPDDQRKGRKQISSFEIASLLTARANQLARGLTIPDFNYRGEIRPYQMAKLELKYAKGKIPLTIRRHNPDGSCEDWTINELIFLDDDYRERF